MMSSMSLIFVWLDQRLGNVPGSNEKFKEKFRKILSPLRQFDKPTMCIDFLKDSTKDKRVIFLTTNVFAEEDFLRTIASLSNVIFIYIYDPKNNQFHFKDSFIQEKLGDERIIHFDERLYEQLVLDLVHLYQNQGNQLEKNKEKKEAKQFYQYATQLIDTVDEKDQDLQQIQRDLLEKIDRIK